LVLLLSSELIDILWGLFYFTGLGNLKATILSHSLFFAVIWAVLVMVIFTVIYNRRSALVVGVVVFSHWVVDFITHPMGAIFARREDYFMIRFG
jgi:membrane-bound metal-dependent hydrolase YbcI (DUF457 family)